MKNLSKLILIALVAVAFTACNKDQNNPGYTFFPDMEYSQAYETYSENPVFADGYTNRLPAEGTIPRGTMPYPYKAKSFEDQVLAGVELVNPFKGDESVVAEGKRQYDIFCISCHGELGAGDGQLYTSGLFTAKPTSLIDDFVQNKPDGEIYHVITMGSLSGLMGAHGSQIRPDKRWMIINYVRSLAK